MGRSTTLGLRVSVDVEASRRVFETADARWETELSDSPPPASSAALYAQTKGATDALQQHEDYGRRCAAWLFDERARDALEALEGGPHRIELVLDETLSEVSWELSYDAAWGGFVGLQQHLTIVRANGPLAEPTGARSSGGFLAVAAPNPGSSDYPALTLKRELDAIADSLLATPLEPRYAANVGAWEGAKETLQKGARVFHFSGHSGSDESTGPQLVFQRERSQFGVEPHLIDAAQIALVATRAHTELVVLMACRSASRQGVARALSDGRVPHVVALQSPLTDPEAELFSRGFYGSLVRGDAVDVAVQAGRQELFTLKDGRVGWAFLIHRARSAPRSVLDEPAESRDSRPEAVEQSTNEDKDEPEPPSDQTVQAPPSIDPKAAAVTVAGVFLGVAIATVGVQLLPDAEQEILAKAKEAGLIGLAAVSLLFFVLVVKFKDAVRDKILRLPPMRRVDAALVTFAALIAAGGLVYGYTAARVEEVSCPENTRKEAGDETLCDGEGQVENTTAWFASLSEQWRSQATCSGDAEPAPRWTGGRLACVPSEPPEPEPPDYYSCPTPRAESGAAPTLEAVPVTIVVVGEAALTRARLRSLCAQVRTADRDVYARSHHSQRLEPHIYRVTPTTPESQANADRWLDEAVLRQLPEGAREASFIEVLGTAPGSCASGTVCRRGDRLRPAELTARVTATPPGTLLPLNERYASLEDTSTEEGMFRELGLTLERFPSAGALSPTRVWNEEGTEVVAELRPGQQREVEGREVSIDSEGRPTVVARPPRPTPCSYDEARVKSRIRNAFQNTASASGQRMRFALRDGALTVVSAPPAHVARARQIAQGLGSFRGCPDRPAFHVRIP